MIRKLERQHIAAELAALSSLLDTLPEGDLLGRMSLEYRRDEMRLELAALEDGSENRAKMALYFGGDPAIGSIGLEAGFSSDSLGTFQDLVTKVWAAGDGELADSGPIPDKAASQLHITSLVHGSFGFLLEEIDERGEPLFESELKLAADRVAAYLDIFAGEDENDFVNTLEALDKRVFRSVRAFFSTLYRAKATFRLVEGETDSRFDRAAIERAWLRIEASNVDEEQLTLEGQLLGMIPVGRRFEFEPDGAVKIIQGKVGEKFSQSYLDRMHDEQFAGRRWRAVLHRRAVERRGREATEAWTLIELEEISEQNAG